MVPPYASSTVTPRSPSAPIFFHRSEGNWFERSISAARGAISSRAKPRTVARSMSMSSPRAKRSPGSSIAGVPPERLRARSIRGDSGRVDFTLRLRKRQSRASSLPGPGGRPAAPCADEDLARLALERADLGEHLLDLFALALELLAACGERGDEFFQLRPLVRRRIVELQHLVHLGEGEAEPLPAQDQLQAHPVA